ncbi:hypothetical protein SB775_10755 [Peribacillus sp. SIMBA_075]
MLGEGDNQSKLKAYNDNRDRIPDAVFFLKELMGTSTTWVVLELNKKDRKRYDRLRCLMICFPVDDGTISFTPTIR